MAKKKVLISFQESSITRAQQKEIQKRIKQVYKQFTKRSVKLMIIWSAVPKGQSFTNYKASQMAWIAIEGHTSIDQNKRKKIIMAVCDSWEEVTEISSHDLMVTLGDPEFLPEYLELNIDKINLRKRKSFLVKTLYAMAKSKILTGLFTIPLNRGKN